MNLDISSNAIFAHVIRHSRLPLCITDPNQKDSPIVFANEAFFNLTGYGPEEVIGHNCRFLQGEETSRKSLDEVRRALAEGEVSTIEIINYRKDGSKFTNALQIGPVFDDDGRLIFHFGSQMDVSTARDREREEASLRTSELLHRLRNIVNVMSVVIKMTSRTETDTLSYSKRVVDRLMALGRVHFDTLTDEGPKVLHLEHLAQTLLLAYAPLGEQQVKMQGERVELSTSTITPLTLLLHELATNAVKYGSLGHESGRVDLNWSTDEDGALILQWQEVNGPKVTAPAQTKGSKIVQDLVQMSGGTLQLDWSETGLGAKLRLPLA